MNKEQTLTDYLESKGILVRLGNTMLVTECIDIIDELLTKEKEQREGVIKKSYRDGMLRGLKKANQIMNGGKAWETNEEIAQEVEQYHNEVIKPKQGCIEK